MGTAPRELSSASGRVLYAPELGEARAREWLDAHPGWFVDGAPVPGAEGAEHLVRVESPLGPLVAKREVPRGWKASLVRTGVRPLRSERCFHLARELLWAGIATPEPLACITRSGREACLVTRYVEAWTPWTYLLRGGASGRVHELEETLARTVARLHARGFRHRDLKAPNLLTRSAPGGGVEVLLVDLEGASRSAAITESIRVRDLARLCTSFESAAARLAGVHADSWPRVVRHYLKTALGRSPAEEEVGSFVQRTRSWSTRHIERNLVRGRPIA